MIVLIAASLFSQYLKSVVIAPKTNQLCALVWAQGTNAELSDPLFTCISFTNETVMIANWDYTNYPTAPATNFILGWATHTITNQVPDSTISITNTGLNQTQAVFIYPPAVPLYSRGYILTSTNDSTWAKMAQPFFVITNGAEQVGQTLYRLQVETTTNAP